MVASSGDSKKDLETALLRAQIKHFEGGKDQLTRAVVPAALTLAVLAIGAFVVTSLISSFWETTVQSAQQDIARLEGEKQALENEMSAMLDARAKADGGSMMTEDSIDLQVDLGGCTGAVCAFTVTSHSENSTLDVYGPCVGRFAFPGDTPDFGGNTCPVVDINRVCSTNDVRLQCRYGPFMVSSLPEGAGWWARATGPDGEAVRFIGLK